MNRRGFFGKIAAAAAVAVASKAVKATEQVPEVIAPLPDVPMPTQVDGEWLQRLNGGVMTVTEAGDRFYLTQRYPYPYEWQSSSAFVYSGSGYADCSTVAVSPRLMWCSTACSPGGWE